MSNPTGQPYFPSGNGGEGGSSSFPRIAEEVRRDSMPSSVIYSIYLFYESEKKYQRAMSLQMIELCNWVTSDDILFLLE